MGILLILYSANHLTLSEIGIQSLLCIPPPPPPPLALAVNARTERVKASSQIIATMNMIKKALHIGTSETPRARRIFLNDSNLETQAYH